LAASWECRETSYYVGDCLPAFSFCRIDPGLDGDIGRGEFDNDKLTIKLGDIITDDLKTQPADKKPQSDDQKAAVAQPDVQKAQPDDQKAQDEQPANKKSSKKKGRKMKDPFDDPFFKDDAFDSAFDN